jgi:hypothetical protein
MQPIPSGAIVVQVEALDEAIRHGVTQFLIDADVDARTRERVQHHLPSLLCYAPWPRLEASVAA